MKPLSPGPFIFLRLFLLILLGGVTTLFYACDKDNGQETLVYQNDFKNGDLTDIENGIISKFNNTNVLGRYNKGKFTLNLHDLPDHNKLHIIFDLNIHDTWNGNILGLGNVDGPDIWQMMVDSVMYINTSFCNTECAGWLCPPQSYPANYPTYNYPRTGAIRTDLPGACNLKGVSGGTIVYRIDRIVQHVGNRASIECKDLLVQPNASDQLCDESWSVSNLKVWIINN